MMEVETGKAFFVPISTVKHALVHPLGFKKLSKRSPVERNLRTYFRLPAMPTQHQTYEKERIERMMRFVKIDEKKKGLNETAKLDGFLLCAACEVDDPENAIEGALQDRNISNVEVEDLVFFTNLKFLDVSGNSLKMHEFENLPALQELHLRCNGINELTNSPSTFLNIRTLDLSYNHLTSSCFEQLFLLPNLEKLDLSGNKLGKLPASLEGLAQLTHLSLEGNTLGGDSCLRACGTIPNLVDLNLSDNNLKQVTKNPLGSFPKLARLALAHNKFEYFEDLFPLTTFPELGVVLIFGNARLSRRDLEILNHELNLHDILLVNDNPIRPKQKISKFYLSNAKKMIRVDVRDPVREQILKKRKERAAMLNTHSGDLLSGFEERPMPVDVPLSPSDRRATSPDSFFITGAAGLLMMGDNGERAQSRQNDSEMRELAEKGLAELYEDSPTNDKRRKRFTFENKEWTIHAKPHASTARGAVRELRQLLSKPVSARIGDMHFVKTTKAADSRAGASAKLRESLYARSR